MMKANFVIVTFVDEDDSPGIIASNWINSENTCFYPNVRTEEQKEKLLKKMAEPEDTWPQYTIKILKRYETYGEARGNLKKAEETSNLESDDEDNRRRRIKKVTSKYPTPPKPVQKTEQQYSRPVQQPIEVEEVEVHMTELTTSDDEDNRRRRIKKVTTKYPTPPKPVQKNEQQYSRPVQQPIEVEEVEVHMTELTTSDDEDNRRRRIKKVTTKYPTPPKPVQKNEQQYSRPVQQPIEVEEVEVHMTELTTSDDEDNRRRRIKKVTTKYPTPPKPVQKNEQQYSRPVQQPIEVEEVEVHMTELTTSDDEDNRRRRIKKVTTKYPTPPKPVQKNEQQYSRPVQQPIEVEEVEVHMTELTTSDDEDNRRRRIKKVTTKYPTPPKPVQKNEQQYSRPVQQPIEVEEVEVHMTELTTSDDEDNRRRRIKKVTTKYPTPPKPVQKNEQQYSRPVQQPIEVEEVEVHMTELTTSSNRAMNCPSGCIVSKQLAVQQSHLIQVVTDLAQQMTELNRKVDLLLVHSAQQPLNPQTEDPFAVPDFLASLPVKDDTSFCQLNDQLQINQNKQAIIKYLAGIGGRDIRTLTTNMLRRVLLDDVAELYSLTGKQMKNSNKKPFLTTETCKIIFQIAKKIHDDVTEEKLKEITSDWLNQAKIRVTRRAERQNKTTQSTTTT